MKHWIMFPDEGGFYLGMERELYEMLPEYRKFCRKATEQEMLEGAQLLKTILDTKGCPTAEQAERFADLLSDSGMEQKLVLPF